MHSTKLELNHVALYWGYSYPYLRGDGETTFRFAYEGPYPLHNFLVENLGKSQAREITSREFIKALRCAHFLLEGTNNISEEDA